MLYDISRALTPKTAVFPGDTQVTITSVMRIADGASCNVTALAMSAHAGTHIDAPLHYADTGAPIDAVSLETLIGRCRVITHTGSGMITDADLQAIDLHGVTRLLFHTRASAVPDDLWEPDFAAFTPEAAERIGSNGIRFIGTDAPSVDPASSKTLPAHMTFLRHNVIICENLCLTGVPDGDYELIALPLRIAGNDAAQARVILRTI
jgi:arylformamidase